MSNIFVLSSSLRPKSVSHALAEAFVESARLQGHEVIFRALKTYPLNYCIGCGTCHKTLRCIHKDDGNTLAQELKRADIVVFASPIYFYSVSGALKTFFDRMNPLYMDTNHFTSVYLLAAAAEKDDEVFEGATKAVQGFVDCFPQAQFKGHVYAGNTEQYRNPQEHPAIEAAKNLAASL